MILAGDIGGTHTRLALLERGKIVSEHKYHSRNYSGLEQIVTEYLDEVKTTPLVASFGIAGAVQGGICKATNLPWHVDAAHMAKRFGFTMCYLLNDLVTKSYGLAAVDAKHLRQLQQGNPKQQGNRALIAAGTGLGEAGLYWDGKRYHPFACEGGHCDFAPRNPLEVDLLFYLQRKFPHVSYERVVSGPGLHCIYQFLVECGHEHSTKECQEEMLHSDPSRVVSAWGLEQKDRACTRALDWFLSLYGAEAGNLALKMLSFGGFYIAGGIAAHLVDRMASGDFLPSFRNKGRFGALLTSMPVWVVMDDNAASLMGAAIYAKERHES